VAGERLRRHCPGRELASTARLPAPVSWGVRAAGAGRPEVPARRARLAAPVLAVRPPGGTTQGPSGTTADDAQAAINSLPRTADQSPSLPIAGFRRTPPDLYCASSSAFSGVNPTCRATGWLRSQEPCQEPAPEKGRSQDLTRLPRIVDRRSGSCTDPRHRPVSALWWPWTRLRKPLPAS
jgi:hypothetical protein